MGFSCYYTISNHEQQYRFLMTAQLLLLGDLCCVLPIEFGPVGGFDPGTMGNERTVDDLGTIGDETTAGTTTGTMWD